MKKAIMAVVAMAAVVFCSPSFAAEKQEAVPAQTAPVPVAAVSAGQWTKFEQGQYIIATNNQTGRVLDLVVVFSMWDPMVQMPGMVYVASRNMEMDKKSKVYRLASALGVIPGIVDVVISKHRVEVQRAPLYAWDVLMPKILDVFKKSDLEKGR